MVKKILKNMEHKNLVLLIIGLAQFMVVLDTAIVNVALPSIAKSLNYNSPESLQWVVTAYTLVFGGFLLLGGRAADLFGRKKIFLSGLILFTAISFVCGIANNTTTLDIARGLQGFAAAFMSPAALSILLTTFAEGKERHKALGVWGAIAAGGAAAGVLIGGILTEYLGWRWNFFVNVPVGILVILMTIKYVKESTAELDHSHLDIPGAVLVTSGLMTLVYGLTEAPKHGWLSHQAMWFIIPSILLLVGFVVNESKSKHPLVPLSIFRMRNLSGANLTMLPITAGMFSMFFFLTLYVQNILHYSPIRSGLSFLPITFIIGIVSTMVASKLDKIGFKIPLIIGPVFMAIGLYLLSQVRVNGTYLHDVLPGLSILAVGMGLIFVSTTTAATNGVSEKDSGLASGLLNTSQQIGGSLGLAVLSGVASSAATRYIHEHGANAVAEAQVKGFEEAFMVGALLTLIGIVIVIVFIKEVKSSKKSTKKSTAMMH